MIWACINLRRIAMLCCAVKMKGLLYILDMFVAAKFQLYNHTMSNMFDIYDLYESWNAASWHYIDDFLDEIGPCYFKSYSVEV